MSSKDVGGKTIQCLHTGLGSDLTDCGTQSDWYAYVFVGTISAITPSKDNEQELLGRARRDLQRKADESADRAHLTGSMFP